MHVLLISTYDMGRQPFGLASPAAWLKAAGVEVVCVDLDKERLDDALVHGASLVACFLPMHTATRLAMPVIDRIRATRPDVPLAAYGLYAPLNAALLREHGVRHVLGGEFEEDLVRIALGQTVADTGAAAAGTAIPRLAFRVPDRGGLLPLARYATLQAADGRRMVGYTEATRGCKHRCRHCPIVPVYDGRFRTVPVAVVLGDVGAQVAAGAAHITFGDPDFFNGIRHAEAVIAGMARQFPGVSYDVTIKVEHLLEHAAQLPRLRDTGCAFVTSAVESIDDQVLGLLEKGHTRADFERVAALCRDTGLPLAATFVAFTPWTTPASYLELLRTIDRLDLVENVAPIQLAVRLLIPQGSRMLELEEVRGVTAAFDPASLTYPWTHRDPAVDALHRIIAAIVGRSLTQTRREAFARIWDAAHRHAGVAPPNRAPSSLLPRSAIPYLNEPWYC